MKRCSDGEPPAPAAWQFPDPCLIVYRDTTAARRANAEIKQAYLAL